MPRCQSWKPLAHVPASHEAHIPGECRTCWRPCRARVADGEVRCEECTVRLTEHPNSLIRQALAAEHDTPDDTLEYLQTDTDPAVSKAAERTLMRRKGAH